jgi:hypothetical protein
MRHADVAFMCGLIKLGIVAVSLPVAIVATGLMLPSIGSGTGATPDRMLAPGRAIEQGMEAWKAAPPRATLHADEGEPWYLQDGVVSLTTVQAKLAIARPADPR